MKKILFILSFILLSSPVFAHCQDALKLDSQKSTIQFDAFKNGGVKVSGKFKNVWGHYDGRSGCSRSSETCDLKHMAGLLGEVVVDINSLDTGVPARNENLKKLFFETDKPGNNEAVFTLYDLLKKDSKCCPMTGCVETLTGELKLHGTAQKLKVAVVVQPIRDGVSVKTLHPVDISFSKWDFSNKIVKTLMKACGHKMLNHVAQVSLDLTFLKK